MQSPAFTESKKLQAVLEYYMREYFKSRKESMESYIKANPAIVNKEYKILALGGEIESIIQEASQKVNDILLMLLDIYSLGYEKEVREFEEEILSTFSDSIAPIMKRIATTQLQDIIEVLNR